MKILQINKFFYLKGGAERHFLDLSKLLEENGHAIIHFSMNDSRNNSSQFSQFFADKVDLDQFSPKNILKIFYNWDAVKKLEALILQEKPDIAHLHNIYHQLSPAIINVLKKHNIPMVMTLHDYKIICPNYQLFSNGKTCTDCAGGKYYNCLLKKCSKNSYAKSFLAMAEAYLHNTFLKTYDQVDLFIAPCQYLKDMCVRFGVPENKITTLYNFTEAPALPKELDTGISVSDKISDQPYFLFFGRISEEKGINVLFEAFKKNNKSLIIIGTGPEFKKYQAQIDNERIGNIKMIGPKYGKDLQNIIANAEAILIPSIWPENNPLTMLETMAMGKPVIASHTGGIPEIIKHQENGLLFEMGNAEDLILKINELNTTNLEVLGQKAKETISSLNKENYYQNIVNIYNKLKKY